MELKEYLKLIDEKPTPWAEKHGLSPATISRRLRGQRISAVNGMKIVEASGGAVSLKEATGV